MSERFDEPLIRLPGPATKQLSQPERRSDIRYPFTAAAEVFDILSQTRIVGRTADMGRCGCYIDTLSPFTAGSLVRVRLQHEAQEFESIATVAYADAPMGMGLAFSDIKPKYQAVLQVWLAKLGGEHPAESETPARPAESTLGATAGMRHVLKELITLMVRKKIINEVEGAGLMRQLSR